MRRRYPFSELNGEHSFTLVASQASYALPGDFDFEIWGTHWNRTKVWNIVGPLSPQEWQLYKSGLYQATTDQAFRLKGCGLSQYVLEPTPGTGDAGATCVFEYQTKSCIKPAAWANNTAYSAGAFCFYDGVIYRSTSGGTSSGTKPSDDVGINDWTAYTGIYDTFLLDTDSSKFDEDVLELGVKAYFKKEKKLEGWDADMAEFWEEVAGLYSRTLGAWVLATDGSGPQMPWPNPVAVDGYDPDPYS